MDHNLEVTKYNKDLHVQEHQEDFLERTTALALNILYNKKKVNFVSTGTFALNDVITLEDKYFNKLDKNEKELLTKLLYKMVD